MLTKNLQNAKAEALRFLAAVVACEEEHAAQKAVYEAEKKKRLQDPSPYHGYLCEVRDEVFNSPKHTGAVKRASMDLSRSLATLRANKY